MYKLDQELIRLLRVDASQSANNLARQLSVSTTTVRRRMKALRQDGVIKLSALVDPAKAGYPVTCIIGLDINHEDLDSAAQMLVTYPEVAWASISTGRYDLLLLTRFSSTESLSCFVQNELKKTPGIRGTETFICLDIRKGKHGLI